ncbi:recombinase family protein [Mangrovactinospora gilvigrisea]|uniref:Recombinase family protein n=1 Tax=Mangrovactinospora gilvigrisea TaxID=1428644 RepID=A0A1J7C3I4_9ACTN|nr:recombinase family protein [Mangrovactinospora gilvigrisea]OIV36104.1 recombinase family protein [Mangrovactinospora gilvigrisea]
MSGQRSKAGQDERPWSPAELAELTALQQRNEQLPEEAPRALLSVRLSVLTDETTSPVRQELDLWRNACDSGLRVVGVARDLNVSATKIPPWKRKELGDWLNNRSPEFDILLFWKLDRFVRRIIDLQVVIEWCQKYAKNLKSLHDPIDLSTTMGKTIVSLIAGMAEIEAANTSTRVASLWEYNKSQDKWITGRPAYGYRVRKNDKGENALEIHPEQAKVLRYARRATLRGLAATRIAKILNRANAPTRLGGKWTSTTILICMRNPAIMGYRVEMRDKYDGGKRSQLVLGTDGKPIRVGEAILTDEEFEELQTALDSKSRRNAKAWTKDSTKFLGVIKHKDCGTNFNYRVSKSKGKRFFYLRCRACTGKGIKPEILYDALITSVMAELGDTPVEFREYARGAEMRGKVKHLEGRIDYYMKGLAPGGRFARGGFVQDNAEESLEALMKELEDIDPATTEDRWVLTHGGKTYREQWEQGTMEEMHKDLLRAGITFLVSYENGEHVGELHIPEDVRNRLVIREDDFALGM